MRRDHPRFFLSNVIDGDSPGKYIIASTEPYMVLRVHDQPENKLIRKSHHHHEGYGDITLELVNRQTNKYDGTTFNESNIMGAMKDAAKWYRGRQNQS